jgi:hypothetical protein
MMMMMPVHDALLHLVLPGKTGRDSKVVQGLQGVLPSPGDVECAAQGAHVNSPVGPS